MIFTSRFHKWRVMVDWFFQNLSRLEFHLFRTYAIWDGSGLKFWTHKVRWCVATPKRIETQLFINILLGFYYSIFFWGHFFVKQNDAQCPISVRPSCKRWSRRTWRNELSERAWRSDASGFSVFLFPSKWGNKINLIYTVIYKIIYI